MEFSGSTTVSFPNPIRTLVIMAKAPKLGMVKTRLIESLPPPAVTALYRCLLEDTLSLSKSLTNVQVAVMCPESDQEELVNLLGVTTQVLTQVGEGLAAGLTTVFRHFTATGPNHVIAFNSDSPHLPPLVLDRAFEILATHDVVVGPTDDGGYYLIGAKAAHPSLFQNEGMGTKSALDRLLTRAKILELSIGFTEPFYDIDVPYDLVLLDRELHLAPGKAPRTAAWFDEWQHVVAPLRHCAGSH